MPPPLPLPGSLQLAPHDEPRSWLDPQAASLWFFLVASGLEALLLWGRLRRAIPPMHCESWAGTFQERPRVVVWCVTCVVAS